MKNYCKVNFFIAACSCSSTPSALHLPLLVQTAILYSGILNQEGKKSRVLINSKSILVCYTITIFIESSSNSVTWCLLILVTENMQSRDIYNPWYREDLGKSYCANSPNVTSFYVKFQRSQVVMSSIFQLFLQNKSFDPLSKKVVK